jgi:hypothetical protein
VYGHSIPIGQVDDIHLYQLKLTSALGKPPPATMLRFGMYACIVYILARDPISWVEVATLGPDLRVTPWTITAYT